ncbi:MalM family protein [Klebsiella pneumoniae]|uniref:MalM family protein n=1 Tax=Klebsiella pneumoniae TaxID=573 RepID=UPI0018880918
MGRSVKLISPLDFSVFIPSVMILDENFNVVNVIKVATSPTARIHSAPTFTKAHSHYPMVIQNCIFNLHNR